MQTIRVYPHGPNYDKLLKASPKSRINSQLGKKRKQLISLAPVTITKEKQK